MSDLRLCGWFALACAVLTLAGIAGLDRALAEGIRAAGIANAAVFVHGLAFLDRISGIHAWLWTAACIASALGLAGLAWRGRAQAPLALLTAGIVQFLTLQTMILGKQAFGRLRPYEVLDRNDWTHAWFAGGGSFPSGHAAFYFGLLLPLAAACPRAWQRAALLAIPVFVGLARMDMEWHFLSDITASALVAALCTMLPAAIVRARRARTGARA